MDLIVFPLKHENPFCMKMKTGHSEQIDSKTMILCSGKGSPGVKNLTSVLSDFCKIQRVIEFGSAASVSKGKKGSIYESTRFMELDGTVLWRSGKITNLPVSAVTGSDGIYEGEKLEWAELIEVPVLYTMETLGFKSAATEYGKDFVSLRIVTDDGCGDVREQVSRILNDSKKKIRCLLDRIREGC